MKKIISVLLSVLMIFSVVCVGVSAADENSGLVIAVANDTHYNMAGANYTGTYTEDYANVVTTGQLKLENELIIDEFLAQVAAGDCEAVLIPGDITDNGLKEEHLYIAAKFLKFEQETGKQIYVVPGNHDYIRYRKDGVDPEYIRTVYAPFGYAQAIAHDTATASYVADINDEYRLLAIDASSGVVVKVTQELCDWIEAQAVKAQQDGKKLIAMSHYNLLEHLVLVETIHPGSILNTEFGLPELFAKYNIKYHFTGHTHDHDVAEYTGSNGVTIYDIVTASLNAYPNPYRIVRFGEDVKIETKFIDKIDTTSLKGKITDATYTLATENFPEYSKNLLSMGLEKTINNFLTAKKIKSVLKLDSEEDAELCAIIDKIIPGFVKVANMPLYKEDETVKGESMESILSEYEISIPESEYSSFVNLAVGLYNAHLVGDENNGILSRDFAILTACLTGSLNYILADVTAEEYATVMSLACELLGAQVPVDFFSYAGTGLKKAEGIDIFIAAVASPIFLEFTTDIDPDDNNVTLSGYTVKVEEPVELTFWEKVLQFFKDLLSYFLRIIGIK